MMNSEFTPEMENPMGANIEINMETNIENLQQLEVMEQQNLEQQEMDACAEANQEMAQEQQEMDEGAEMLGYSSEYYEHEMERAIKNGNKIALEHAKRNYAHAKAKETTKKMTTY